MVDHMMGKYGSTKNYLFLLISLNLYEIFKDIDRKSNL